MKIRISAGNTAMRVESGERKRERKSEAGKQWNWRDRTKMGREICRLTDYIIIWSNDNEGYHRVLGRGP